MAVDNKNQSASDGSGNVPATVVSGDSRPNVFRRTLNHLRAGNKKTILIIVAAIVLIVAFLHFGLHVGQKVYSQAAGHKVYKEDVENLIGNTKGISEREAATVLADKYLTEAMAKQEGITVTNAELEKAYGPTIQQQKTKNPYSYQLQVNQLYFDKLQVHNQGVYKGDLLVAQFSRNIILNPGTVPNMKSAAVVADKEYAKNFITRLYNEIKAGKISWAQAAQQERQDPVVGESAYPTLSHSGPFDTAVAPVSLFTPNSAREQLSKIKAGQTSRPFVVSVKNTVNLRDQKPFDSYYLVVKLDSSSGGSTGMNFQDELAQAKKRLGYEVNI